MKKIKFGAWKDIVSNNGELFTHRFMTESVEQTQNYAQAFASVANVQSRLYQRFRLGLHAPRPGLSRSGLGMSTFAKALVGRDTGNFKIYASGDFNQEVGYTQNLGLVSIQDNKASIFPPAIVSKALSLFTPLLEIEEHAARGKRQFHAVIGFWDCVSPDNSDAKNKRKMVIYAGEELFETENYQCFLDKVEAQKIVLKAPEF